MRAMPEKMLLMLAFFFKNPLSVKNAFLMPAQLPDAYSGRMERRKRNDAFLIFTLTYIGCTHVPGSHPPDPCHIA